MIVSSSPVFWILIALAVVTVVVFLERFAEIRRARVDWQDFIKGVVNVLDRGGGDEAIAICEEAPSPVANIVKAAIRNRGSDAQLLREAVDAQGRAEAARFDRRLASLAIIGQIAPMVGLFGTILGLVRTLTVANSTELVSRADFIAPMIHSLVLAALGLAVAIPAIVMYSALRVRVDRLVADLEAAATNIVGYLSGGAREGGVA